MTPHIIQGIGDSGMANFYSWRVIADIIIYINTYLGIRHILIDIY